MKPTVDDVHLSLRRYLSQTLEPADPAKPWRIRLEREPIADSERPMAVLDAGRLSTPFRRRTPEQGPVRVAQPITVTAYPETTGSVRAAGRRARRLQQHLEDVNAYGLDLGRVPRFPGGPLRPRGGPGMIPIYDYADVAVEGDAEDRSLPEDAEPIAWATVEDSGADAIQDVEDAHRWTVVWELRLAWDRGGRIAQVDPQPLQSVPFDADAVPPPGGPFS